MLLPGMAAWTLPAASLGFFHTPWVLFTIFVLGPSEPLIPVLMFPAARNASLLMTYDRGGSTIYSYEIFADLDVDGSFYEDYDEDDYYSGELNWVIF
ncbi:MAG TPA: hypothetical protein PLR20_01590 [Syntrophales bacterium]|nr:hypothetical protein [Syntrophales bacterium]HOX94674.1 hypothetical protein [Syntrophales bacterium]HPI56862.1 hypothetical protein [Syntrophales bacterium]HPN23448.1 hypothetical protein [Syntrophales bacterium]HQM28027.1 hypothetical protein [Syntrophales bacterium]